MNKLSTWYELQYNRKRGRRKDAGTYRDTDIEETLDDARNAARDLRAQAQSGEALIVGDITLVTCQELEKF